MNSFSSDINVPKVAKRGLKYLRSVMNTVNSTFKMMHDKPVGLAVNIAD